MATGIPRVDVVFLAYSEEADKAPSVTLDSICTYNAALVEELRTTGKGQPRPLLQAFHWYIETSNRNAFRIEGQQYDAVSLVVAAEVEHWFCARHGHSAQGSRARVVSFSDQTNVPIGATHASTPAKSQVAVHQRHHRHRLTTLERIGEEC
uniref:Uncharacterized protein n=1 Tax=Anopheles christyi TaxID=43041 RepID=A0A182KFC3_9DIPT